jgi:hypothetical protein
MKLGSTVTGINFEGKKVTGSLESVVGFGTVGIVRTSPDRLGLTECHMDKITEQK